jgi:hypothetical protein
MNRAERRQLKKYTDRVTKKHMAKIIKDNPGILPEQVADKFMEQRGYERK